MLNRPRGLQNRERNSLCHCTGGYNEIEGTPAATNKKATHRTIVI